MPRPVQGFDVSVSVIGPNGPAFVGEFEEITLNINNDVEEYLELNSRMPVLLDGEIKLDGSLRRGYIDVGSALQNAFGSSSLQPGAKITSPRFVIAASFDAPDKGLSGRYILTQSIINKLALSATAGKNVVRNDYTFRSEGIQEA